MNLKNFVILAVITALLVVAAVSLNKPRTAQLGAEQELVYPQLLQQLQDITEITVSTKDDSYTIVKDGEQWGMKERAGYPVAATKAAQVLMGAADLRTLEEKTANPELYSKLQVEDVSAENAASVQVTLKKSDGSTAADLIVGKSKPAKIDATRKEIYIRKAGDKPSWLALGSLNVDKQMKSWLEQEIINIDSKRIRSVEVTQGKDKFRIFKENAEDKEYQLADLPENGKVKSLYALNAIVGVLGSLKLEDVSPVADVDFSAPELNALYHTFGGLEIQVSVAKKDDSDYMQFKLAYQEPAATEEKTESEADTEKQAESEGQAESPEKADTTDKKPSPEDLKKEAEELNTKLQNWAYKISSYKMQQLRKKHAELFSISSGEEENASTDKSADNPFAAFANQGTAAAPAVPLRNPFQPPQ